MSSSSSPLPMSASASASGSASVLQQQYAPTPLERVISACSGALATSFIVTPLDVVKTRLQAAQPPDPSPRIAPGTNPTRCGLCGFYMFDNGLMEVAVSKSSCPYFEMPGTGTGMGVGTTPQRPSMGLVEQPSTMRALMTIAREEGMAGLYRGLAPTLVMAVPSTVLYFTTYDYLKAKLHEFVNKTWPAPAASSSSSTGAASSSGWRAHLPPLLGGSLARIFAASIISPLELVRTRSQSVVAGTATKNGTGAGSGGGLTANLNADRVRAFQRSFVHQLVDIVRTEGVGALFRGLRPTLWRDVPFSAFYWVGYEAIKKKLAQSTLYGDPSSNTALMLQSFIAGAVSGGVAALITTPFDVVKTRQQVWQLIETSSSTASSGSSNSAGCPKCGSGAPALERPVFSIMATILREEGPRALFAGSAARLAKVSPACAVMIASFELGKQLFAQRHEARASSDGRAAIIS